MSNDQGPVLRIYIATGQIVVPISRWARIRIPAGNEVYLDPDRQWVLPGDKPRVINIPYDQLHLLADTGRTIKVDTEIG